MATSSEQAFVNAINAAELARQNAKSSAFTTYGFVKANYAAYVTALIAADVAYINAISRPRRRRTGSAHPRRGYPGLCRMAPGRS